MISFGVGGGGMVINYLYLITHTKRNHAFEIRSLVLSSAISKVAALITTY